MRTGKTDSFQPGFSVGAAAVLILLINIAACSTGQAQDDQFRRAQATGTMEAERLLTATHGDEAQLAIERFESLWLSLDSYKNPDSQSELATGRYLDYWGLSRMGQNLYSEPFWLVTKAAMAKTTRVLTYSPERFTAVAQVESIVDKVSVDGALIQPMPPREACRFYAFAREGSAWKVAALFDMTVWRDERDIERDWEREPDWSKQLLGELPPDRCK